MAKIAHSIAHIVASPDTASDVLADSIHNKMIATIDDSYNSAQVKLSQLRVLFDCESLHSKAKMQFYRSLDRIREAVANAGEAN